MVARFLWTLCACACWQTWSCCCARYQLHRTLASIALNLLLYFLLVFAWRVLHSQGIILGRPVSYEGKRKDLASHDYGALAKQRPMRSTLRCSSSSSADKVSEQDWFIAEHCEAQIISFCESWTGTRQAVSQGDLIPSSQVSPSPPKSVFSWKSKFVQFIVMGSQVILRVRLAQGTSIW